MLINNLNRQQVEGLYKGLLYPEDRSVLYGGDINNVSYLIDGEVRICKRSKKVHRDDLYLILTRAMSPDAVMSDEQYNTLNKDYYKIAKQNGTDFIYVKVTRYVNVGGGLINFTDPINNITITSKPVESLLDGENVNDMTISIHSERYNTLVLGNGMEFDTRPNTIEHKEVMIFRYFINDEPVEVEKTILEARKNNMLYIDMTDYTENRVVIDSPYLVDDGSKEILVMEQYMQNRKASDFNETRAMEIDIKAKELQVAVIAHEKKLQTMDMMIEELVDKYHKVKHMYYADIEVDLTKTGDRLTLLDNKLTAFYTDEEIASEDYMNIIKKFSLDIYDTLSQTI
jgi:hypothetical protein